MGSTHVYKARVKRWRAKLDKYEEQYRTFVQKKLKVYVKLAEAQTLLYNQVAVFFSETDASCIQRYELSVFVEELLEENLDLFFTDFRVNCVEAPCGS